MPEIKPKPQIPEELKSILGKLEKDLKEKLKQKEEINQENKKRIDECVKRRKELNQNSNFIIGILKYADIILNTFKSGHPNTQNLLAMVAAVFISAENEGLIKINDKYVAK